MTDKEEQRVLEENIYRAELELADAKAQNKLLEDIIKRLKEKELGL
jgi:hypothetical protein